MDIKVRYSLHIEPGGTQRATVVGFAKRIVVSGLQVPDLSRQAETLYIDELYSLHTQTTS